MAECMIRRSHAFTEALRGMPTAVSFLWHYPADRSGSPLATTVPCPVRTFLPVGVLNVDRATASPAPSAEDYILVGGEAPCLRSGSP